MEEMLQSTESAAATVDPIASVLEHVLPTVIISSVAISIILIIYFIYAIATRVSNHKRTLAMQQDIHEIRQLLEKHFAASNVPTAPVQPTRPQPEVRLADGAIKDPLFEEQKIETERIV